MTDAIISLDLGFYETLERVEGSHPVKNVQLYAYEDTRDTYERAALVIDHKLCWLDIQDFTIEQLRPYLENIGVCVNVDREQWGIYHGIIGHSRFPFYITHFDRAEADINTLATTSHKSISNYMEGYDPFWDLSDLLEEYDLVEQFDDDEDDE